MSKPLEDYTPELRALIRCKRKEYYVAHRETMLAQSKAAQQKRRLDPAFKDYRRAYYKNRRRVFALRLHESLFPLLESNPDISLDQIADWLNEHEVKDFCNHVAWTGLRVRNILKIGLGEDD